MSQAVSTNASQLLRTGELSLPPLDAITFHELHLAFNFTENDSQFENDG